MSELYDEELLDKEMIQILQEAFCAADRVYCLCIDRFGEFVTNYYGSDDEKEWIEEHVQPKIHEDFWYKLLGDGIECVVEEELAQPYAKVCAQAIRISDKTTAVWVVLGFLEERITPEDEIPPYVMTTTEARYYKSLELLEALSKQYLSAKMSELMLMSEFRKSRDSQKVTEAELKRSLTMTNILQKLESDEGSTAILRDVFAEICDYMELSAASLACKKRDGEGIMILCSYGMDETDKDKLSSGCPYFTGKPYMISSDTIMPEIFRRWYERTDLRASIHLPLKVNEETTMYLNFYQTDRERNWEMSEIKFLNDVKRIGQLALMKRAAQDSLAISNASLEAVLENVGCGIYVRSTKDNTNLYTNKSYRELFPDEEDSAKLMDFLENSTDYTEYFLEKSKRWFDVRYSEIRWVDGRDVKLYTVYEVTDKKLYQQKIERQANNDFLTGLYNRMRCEHDLHMFVDEAASENGQGALLYIDLDDFKNINDGLGHQYGDILLQFISRSLRKVKGIENTCYRMGGDEFVIIVPHGQYERLANILESIRSIFAKPWYLKGGSYYCTMSMGIVSFPMNGNVVEELIRKADVAMYQAKKTGKNKAEYYCDSVEPTAFERLDLENKMRNATLDDCREFTVYFQPIMGQKGECQGAEALIRWKSDGMGLVSPCEFIPLAEYLGLINPIGDFVLEEACRHLKCWNDMGHPDYQVNVNLSVVQLLQNDIVSKIQKIIEKTRIIPKNLVLEVTESLAVNDMERMKKILGSLKELGVRVALDDFGTGYSSLNHIREMPLDIIKIDRCFVMDIGKDEFSESFIKMVAELASTIGVSVCVEGVETKEQFEILSKMRVEHIQGFYYDKPLTAERFEQKYL